MTKITAVKSKRDLTAFIDFPHALYSNDPNYVPELFIAQRDLLNGKHPFFKHAKVACFLAKEGNKVVGRIAAIRNGNHIKFTGKPEGFFGFFDVANNYTVAKNLLDTAIGWLKEENMESVVGPANFSTNETCGLLVDGFDCPPPVMLTYNKSYYRNHIEKYGFVKKMDLFAYKLEVDEIPDHISVKASSLEERLKERGIIIRSMKMKDFTNEVKKVQAIYNSAWDKNWGFVPMSDEEFNYMAKDLKMILDPDFALIAEHKGQPIGFSLTLPDINLVLKKIPRGRLLPTGLFKLLYFKNKVKQCRVITLGVIQQYRRMGIDACFYSKSVETARRKNYKIADASWILENNAPMNNALKALNGKVYKTYRMYHYDLR